MLILLLACEGEAPGGFAPQPTENIFERWPVEGLSWDLAVLDGRIVSTTQFGGSIYAWDPDTEEEEELGDDLGETQAVVVDGETIFFTVTDSGMTGFVARLESIRQYTELVSEGDAGLPMRRLEDMTMGPDGLLYAADPGAEAVWRIHPDGSSAKVVTRNVTPTCVAFHEGQLHWGTADGIFQWDDGTEVAIQILDQGAYGMLSDQGELLLGTDEGVVVEGELIASAEELGRPAGMVRIEGSIYVADQGQGSVWSFER